MARAAATVRQASARNPGAVVDPAVVEPAAELSAFTYQKGAWVLHMLWRKLGDEGFFRGLRRYYEAHAGGTATTRVDLPAIPEAVEADAEGWLLLASPAASGGATLDGEDCAIVYTTSTSLQSTRAGPGGRLHHA